MEYQIDARGMACPLPVMKTSQLLGEIKEGTVVVIVDNAAALENIKRLAENMRHSVSAEEKAGDYYVTISKCG